MSKCKNCSPRNQVLGYNVRSGKYNLVNEQGATELSSLESNSLVHGRTQILKLGKGFIASEPFVIPPLDKIKYLESTPNLAVAMIARLEYTVQQATADTVLCNSPYWTAIIDYDLTNYAFNTGGRCAKYCATEEVTVPPPGSQLQWVEGEDGAPCFNIPDPGPVISSTIVSGFFGSRPWGQSSLASSPPQRDFPGAKPARYSYDIVFSGESRNLSYGYCFFGINPYGPLERFTNSANAITVILPTNFCGPQCQADVSNYPTSWYGSKIFQLGQDFPGLFRNPFWAEWAIADWDRNLYLAGKDNENFRFALPVGRFDGICFFDPFPRTVGFGAYAIGPTAWPKDASLSLHIFNWGKTGTHRVIGSSILVLQRLPYTESRFWYDAEFVPDLDIVEYVLLLPIDKKPSEWSVVSLLKMKSIEHAYDATVDKANINLAYTELDTLHAGIQHGYYEPAALDKGDQLLSSTVDHSYVNGETVIVKNVVRYPLTGTAALPANAPGNYAYDAWYLPPNKPTDITSEQQAFRHTHTVTKGAVAYEAKPTGTTTTLELGTNLLNGLSQKLDLIAGNVKFNDVSGAAEFETTSSTTGAIEVQNVATALTAHMDKVEAGLTASNITVMDIVRIKPILGLIQTVQ